jgi:hypothetical protein
MGDWSKLDTTCEESILIIGHPGNLGRVPRIPDELEFQQA